MEIKIVNSIKEIEKKHLWKIITIALVVELLVMLAIYFFDPRPCPSEEYSLKWLQSLQLILAAFITFKLIKINKGKIKSFWVLVTVAFSWATLDEIFMIHERIADSLLEKTIISSIYPYPLDSLIIAVYVIVGIILLSYFIRPLYAKYKGEKWLYLLFFAFVIHAYSALADVMSWSCIEEFAEAFAGLFYLLSFISAYLNHKNRE